MILNPVTLPAKTGNHTLGGHLDLCHVDSTGQGSQKPQQGIPQEEGLCSCPHTDQGSESKNKEGPSGIPAGDLSDFG